MRGHSVTGRERSVIWLFYYILLDPAAIFPCSLYNSMNCVFLVPFLILWMAFAFNSVFLFLFLFLFLFQFRCLAISFCPRILSLYSLLNFSLYLLPCSVFFHFPSPLHLCPLLARFSLLAFWSLLSLFQFYTASYVMLCCMLHAANDNVHNHYHNHYTNNDNDDNALWQGTRVEGDRKGKGTWYPGVISCDRSVSQWLRQWVSQSVYKWVRQSVSQWLSQSVTQSVSPSVRDSVNQLVTQSAI